MFRATNLPILRSTFWLYTAFGTVQCTDIAADRQQYRCIVPRCSWKWASLSPETCTANLKRSIKRSINGICCILLVAYFVVLMMHSLTNIKSIVVFALCCYFWSCSYPNKKGDEQHEYYRCQTIRCVSFSITVKYRICIFHLNILCLPYARHSILCVVCD